LEPEGGSSSLLQVLLHFVDYGVENVMTWSAVGLDSDAEPEGQPEKSCRPSVFYRLRLLHELLPVAGNPKQVPH
jgi:hypothetical protein